METKINEILDLVKSINGRVNSINDRVNEIWNASDMDGYMEYPPIVHSKSPIQLTLLGKQILENYKGNTKIDNKAPEFIKTIEDRDFKSPLDIQEYAEKIIISQFNGNDFVDIKNEIYFNPTFENQPVNIRIVAKVMGLYLRDKYFEKHPEFLLKN